MIQLGIILLAVGVSGEFITGDRFRQFFDWDYPEQHSRNTEWMKSKLGRAAIVIGTMLLVVGGVVELA